MSIRELYDQASTAHRAGRLEEAEDLYRRILAADPASFAAQHMLGVVVAQTGRSDEALALIAAALKTNPGDAGALVNYANVLSLKGRFAEAVTAYDRVLAMRSDADVLRGRGHALQGLGLLPQALASYAQALVLNPSDVQALYKQGVVLGELGRADEALAAYDRVLALAPGHVEALNNRGYIWWRNKQDYARAIADLEQAQALDPNLAYGAGAVLHLKMYAADWQGFDQSKAALIDGRWRTRRATCRPAPVSIRRIFTRPSPPHPMRARTAAKSASAISRVNSASRPPPS
jgi:protein O-GlcNAc transferase